MFNPARMRQRHFYDEIFNTMVHQPMQQADIFVTHSVRALQHLPIPIVFIEKRLIAMHAFTHSSYHDTCSGRVIHLVLI